MITKEEKGNDHMLFAEGLGLKHILSHPKIDATKTASNHIMEVETVLGIEAARKSIIKQVGETMK